MNVGDRVITKDGSIGHVESIDGKFADVRYLTPNNEPSCCIGICFLKSLKAVGDNVIPMPKSEAWFQKSMDFYDTIVQAIAD